MEGIPTWHIKDYNDLIEYMKMLAQIIAIQHEKIKALVDAHPRLLVEEILDRDSYMQPIFEFLEEESF